MLDKNGHDLQLNDIATPDNAPWLQLQLVTFDGTVLYCRGRNATDDPMLRYLPEHMVFVERP